MKERDGETHSHKEWDDGRRMRKKMKLLSGGRKAWMDAKKANNDGMERSIEIILKRNEEK